MSEISKVIIISVFSFEKSYSKMQINPAADRLVIGSNLERISQ